MLNVITAAIDPMLIPFAGMGLGVLGMGMGALAIWTEHKRKERSLDVLRAYAEKGEEPPQAILESVSALTNSRRVREDPMTRARAFAQCAFFLIMGLGFAAVTAYFYRGEQAQVWIFTIGFGITAFVMLALSARALLVALTTPPNDVS